MKFEAVSSHPVTSYLGEETNTHLATTAFQVAVESDKVSPQPPLLRLNKHSSLSHTSQDLFYRTFTSFTVLWTRSSNSMSFL